MQMYFWKAIRTTDITLYIHCRCKCIFGKLFVLQISHCTSTVNANVFLESYSYYRYHTVHPLQMQMYFWKAIRTTDITLYIHCRWKCIFGKLFVLQISHCTSTADANVFLESYSYYRYHIVHPLQMQMYFWKAIRTTDITLYIHCRCKCIVRKLFVLQISHCTSTANANVLLESYSYYRCHTVHPLQMQMYFWKAIRTTDVTVYIHYVIFHTLNLFQYGRTITNSEQ
jgi:hypothetical protein